MISVLLTKSFVAFGELFQCLCYFLNNKKHYILIFLFRISSYSMEISIFVKNPNMQQHGKIYFYDIGDYLKRKEKLTIIEVIWEY